MQYGGDDDWERLDADEKPFFQLRETSRGAIDWTMEREWRVLGDIDLDPLPEDAALVFAPSDSEARHLATISRWPVTVVK